METAELEEQIHTDKEKNVENKKKVLRHFGMAILVAAAVVGAVSFRGCTHLECEELSYLPGRCG